VLDWGAVGGLQAAVSQPVRRGLADPGGGEAMARMTGIRVLLRFFEGDFLTKVLFLFLLYSLLPLGEIIIILFIGDALGKYFTLTVAASTGLVGVMVALAQLRTVTDSLRRKIQDGVYPGQEFMGMAGILAGGVLLLTPGFITDTLGFLLFLPFLRNAVGRLITRRMESQLKEVYEYLKLYEL
jgi:UPF0716 protein FxsA